MTVLVPFYRGAVVFTLNLMNSTTLALVLVPFYRGAVVFARRTFSAIRYVVSSRPLLSRSGCIYYQLFSKGDGMNEFSSPFIEERLYLLNNYNLIISQKGFSSPFIEERLYLHLSLNTKKKEKSSRPLLSRSGCISYSELEQLLKDKIVLVPFYRGAVVFTKSSVNWKFNESVLVPFYRGAVVFNSRI